MELEILNKRYNSLIIVINYYYLNYIVLIINIKLI